MSIKKINILEQEGDDSLSFSGRSIEIQTSVKSCKTPTRCATTIEYNSLINIPSKSVSIPDYFSIIPRKLDSNDVNLFISDNGIHKNIVNYLINKTSSARYSSIIMSPILLPKSIQLDSKSYDTFIRRSLFVQNVVSNSFGNIENRFIQSLPFTSDLPITKIESIFRSMSDIDVWAPIIPMDMLKDSFKKAIDLVAEKKDTYQIPLILFVYSDPLDYLENYDYIWAHRTDNIIFAMCDTPREKLQNLSTTHYLHLFGLDSIGRRVFHHGGPSKPVQFPPHLMVKYFDRENLTVNRERDTNTKIDIFNDMPKDTRISEIYESRSLANDDKDVGILKSIANVHEYHASLNELNTVSKYIQKKEYSQYLNDKDVLSETVNQHFKSRPK